MNIRPKSHVPVEPLAATKNRILVWDAPVRVFHWLIVLCFVGAYFTAEVDRWRPVHVALGYTVVGLVVFRFIWGLIGTRYARFSSFVRGPRAVIRYAGSVLRGRSQPYIGHNPAGALAIVALLLLALAVTASGWATYSEIGDFEDVHEAAVNIMLVVIGVHLAGVLLDSWLHRQNLVGAMITGRKLGRLEEGIRSARRSVAVLMLLAIMGFWWLRWHSESAISTDSPTAAAAGHEGRDSDGD